MEQIRHVSTEHRKANTPAATPRSVPVGAHSLSVPRIAPQARAQPARYRYISTGHRIPARRLVAETRPAPVHSWTRWITCVQNTAPASCERRHKSALTCALPGHVTGSRGHVTGLHGHVTDMCSHVPGDLSHVTSGFCGHVTGQRGHVILT
eukprot:3941953-Rhodomonas_salina.2